MKVISAYLLSALAGSNPDAASIKKILDAAGASYDDASIDKLISEVDGKMYKDVIAAGQAKMQAMPAGGVGGGSSGGSGGAAAGGSDNDDGSDSESSSSDGDMGFSLFD